MATKNASGHQGQVKDPEHDGRLKGHKGGEAAKAHADGSHPDEKGHAEPKKPAPKKHDDEAAHAEGAHEGKKGHAEAKKPAPKTHDDEAAHDEPAKKASAKSHKEPAHAEDKSPAKADATSDDADLKSREYTDAEGNVHHHTKKYMETHKGE